MVAKRHIPSVQVGLHRPFAMDVANDALEHDYFVASQDIPGTLLLTKSGMRPMILMCKEKGEQVSEADQTWLENWRSHLILAVVVRPRETRKIKRLLEPKPGVRVDLDGEEIRE